MKGLLRGLAVRLTANEAAQGLLGWATRRGLALMGIGSGSLVESSGEVAVVRRLRRGYRTQDGPLCVFDVGANEGAFLAMVQAELAVLPVRIHAFEPGAETFRALSKRAADLPDVVLNPMALGSAEESRPLYSDRAGSPLASLYQRDLDRFAIAMDRVETVSVTTVDRYCETRGIERIDLLKLDVEGHELEVLRGAERMLRERRIRMVTFEFGGCHVDSRTFFKDFHELLTGAGLGRIQRITPSGHLTPVGPYHEILEQYQTTNYLASPADSPADS